MSNAPLPGVPPPIIRKPRSHTVATEGPPTGLDLSYSRGSDHVDGPSNRLFSGSMDSDSSLNDSGRVTSPPGGKPKLPPSAKPKPITETGKFNFSY